MTIQSAIPVFQAADVHEDFMDLYPSIKRRARFSFRHWPASMVQEAVAECIAAAFASYCRLKVRGKDPLRRFPSTLIHFAVLHVQDDRHVGGSRSTRDVLSWRTQRRYAFQVRPLSCRPEARVAPGREREGDNVLQAILDPRAPVPDQVIIRIDLPAFMRRLTHRDRCIASFLSLGNTVKDAAVRFKLTSSRVSQLRHQWHRDWLRWHGDLVSSPARA
jgi:hypothetical protein